MNSPWKTIIYCRSISWLLVTAILFTALLPAHYHLHHLYSTDSTNHGHAIDLHLITDNVDQSHHDEDTSIFAATPDVITKKDNSEITSFVLLAILLVLLPVLNKRIRIRPGYFDLTLKQHYPYFSPPLRAPPAH